MRYRSAIEGLKADVEALKRHAPTSRLRLYDLGEEEGVSSWSGGAVDRITLPREASLQEWLAYCDH